VIYSLIANFGYVDALFISFFEGRMFSRGIVTKITSARGTLHCSKTRIRCRDQLVTVYECEENRREEIHRRIFDAERHVIEPDDPL
jgi:hypothetical protein